ncbi:MAG: copper resistance protein CopC [Paracoccaceae bacterium]|nr:copper resistance protein CopC [Paracoccaceae bacterium]MDE2918184.1 copper resistance protein CopC [Paracoccaceae bacterium]
MNHFLKLLTLVSFGTVIFSQALAHSDIEMTIPDNEAILEEVPETITIHMTSQVRLIKVEMQHEDHPIIEIDISEYKKFHTEFTLTIEPMGAGIYGIFWRALGQDGHPLKGSFTFTIMD